ncbi:hypothetical protein FOA52_010748 [Chlamydomonas sp. UWO 241]|nr:hypothetical protein FOA52_010748 [Chlamydomonas sp. UWO 241]
MAGVLAQGAAGAGAARRAWAWTAAAALHSAALRVCGGNVQSSAALLAAGVCPAAGVLVCAARAPGMQLQLQRQLASVTGSSSGGGGSGGGGSSGGSGSSGSRSISSGSGSSGSGSSSSGGSSGSGGLERVAGDRPAPSVQQRRGDPAGPPAFVFDIDGVLVRGRKVLPTASAAVRKLVRGDGSWRVPVVFMTNGGGVTEAVKAEQLSTWLDAPVDASQVILSHTPMRSLVPALHDRPVLISGRGSCAEVAQLYGFQRMLTTQQNHRGGLPARVGDTSLRRSFVQSIPVARGANWFLAGGGRRMDEDEAPAAAAERIAAAAEDGTSLPVRLATDVVRFLYGGTGRREPADGGVVSASLLNAKPAVGGIGVEPRGGGVLRVLFTVASDAVADTVVRWRHELRRCVDSTAVFDVLSDREEAQHQALWPAFLAAKVAGKRAQFHRARLVVDGERLGAAMPSSTPLSSYSPSSAGPCPVADLGLSSEAAPIEAVLVMNDPEDWYRDLQLLVDVLMSGGVPMRRDMMPEGAQPVPLYFSNGDLLWANDFPRNRFGQGAFAAAVQALYDHTVASVAASRGLPPSSYPRLVPTFFGKPHAAPFRLAERLLARQAVALGLAEDAGGLVGAEGEEEGGCALLAAAAAGGGKGAARGGGGGGGGGGSSGGKSGGVLPHLPLSGIYAVGDNPAADVRGANAAGHPWVSVLVRTGVFQGPGTNCAIDPAAVTVPCVEAAVDAGLHRARASRFYSMR